MPAKAYDGRTVIADMLEACNGYVEKSAAIRALRAVCRYFGGQLIYIPAYKTTGDTTNELLGVIADEVGDADAGRILEKIMALYGGQQLYIPMEKTAFREIITQEIYSRYDSSQKTMGELCREYGISFNQVYKLYYEGQKYIKQLEFDFEDPNN